MRTKQQAMELMAVVGIVAGFLGLLCLLVKSQRSRQNLPPERSGWVPWLGCAVAFGKAPLLFIEDTRKAVERHTPVDFSKKITAFFCSLEQTYSLFMQQANE